MRFQYQSICGKIFSAQFSAADVPGVHRTHFILLNYAKRMKIFVHHKSTNGGKQTENTT